MSDLTKSGIFQSPFKTTVADNLSTINVSYDEWTRFSDGQDSFNISLDGTARAMWQAKMIVKYKYRLTTIPLCAGRLETGALKNPHVKPKPEYNIFIDKNSNFDSQLFQSAIMLFNLLDMLRDKITEFSYSTLCYCVNENNLAQKIVRDRPKDFKLLYVRLRERFLRNMDVEKDKLQTEFNEIRPQAKETLREYYGRISTLATELQSVYNISVTVSPAVGFSAHAPLVHV